MNIVLSIAFLAFGVLSYALYFNRGEHHMYGVRYVQIAAVVCLLGVFDWSLLREVDTTVGILAISFLTGLFSSTITYRLFLSPLNRFPGPIEGRISCMLFSLGLRKGDAYLRIKKLHDKHGDFVRIGSSDLSIVHPKAMQVIYGHGSKCTKGAWYDLTLPMISVQTFRERALHDQRRRIWSNGFSDKALRGYEQRIQNYQNKLFGQIDTFGDGGVDVTKWFNLYSFDIMGDLAFGTSFNMLDTLEEHWAIKLLNEGLDPLKWMFPVWFFRLMTAVPVLTRNWWRFIDYCAMRAEHRRHHTPAIPDIMSSLLEPLKGREPERDARNVLNGDAQLIVVAGSDTTAATLTHIILELCRNPGHIDKIRTEVSQHMNGDDVLHSQIAHMDHLNGVIQEALRLHPPVPTALPRKTPPEGVDIGDIHVPGNITVYCPQYVIGRKEEIYPLADRFLPERWYLEKGMVKEQSAWAPFSSGPYACIGRPLAMLNLRTTIARIVTRYDIGFSPSEDGRGCEDLAKEHFTLAPGELKITFSRRVST